MRASTCIGSVYQTLSIRNSSNHPKCSGDTSVFRTSATCTSAKKSIKKGTSLYEKIRQT